MVQRENEFILSKLNKDDIPGLINLSASVGWDYDEHEINTVMTAGMIYGHKTDEGNIISSAAIIPYENKLASIGMVIVNEKYRGYGLGKEVTQACVNSVSNDVTIMLIATKEGKPLYERLGFHTVSSVHKFLCDRYKPLYPVYGNRDYKLLPLTNAHFTQVQKLDRAAVGVDRELFLRTRIQQAREGVVVQRKDGEIVGYGLGIEAPNNLILGPIVADNHEIASSIFHNLAKKYDGKLRIDVPDEQHSFLTFIEQSGFNRASQPPLMIINSSQLPPRNNTLYGIAAQIFG